MDYLLVLQFPANSIEDYDLLITLEDQLINSLDLSAIMEFDGHDFGSSEMNLFLITNHPQKVLDRILSNFDSPLISNMKAACRGIEEENYQLLWPENLTEFTIV